MGWHTKIVCVILLAGCATQPFPNSPLDKATQLVTQARAAGLDVPNAKAIAKAYGTVGGVACTRTTRTDPVSSDPTFQQIMRSVYCPSP